MDLSERRLDIVIRWMVQHPGVVRGVRKELNSLRAANAEAHKSMQRLFPAQKQQAQMAQLLRDAYRQQKAAIVLQASPSLKLLNAALKAHAKLYPPLSAQLAKFGSRLTRVGFRLGWFGFRLVIMGRMLVRWFLAPIQAAMKTTKQWDQTIGNIAVSMGLLIATGMGSADMLAFMQETMLGMPEAGMRMRGAFGALQTVIAAIGVDIAPMLSQAIYDLAEAFRFVWQAAGPQVVQLLQTLGTTVMPDLITAIKNFGPAFIVGFVEGLTKIIPLITNLLNTLTPFASSIGNVTGVMAALAPVMVLVGTGIYFLSPTMIALGSAITTLVPLLTSMGTWLINLIGPLSGAMAGVGGVSAMLIPLGVAIAAVGLVIATLVLWWKELTDFWKLTVGPAITALFAAFGKLGKALGLTGTAMGYLKVATTPIMLALKGVMFIVGGLIRILEVFVLSIAHIVDAFKGFWNLLKKIFGFSVHKDIAFSLGEAEKAFKSIQKVADKTDLSLKVPEVPGFGGPGGIGGTQSITVYSTVYIGTVSGVADLDMVKDSVNQGVYESLRRRSWR